MRFGNGTSAERSRRALGSTAFLTTVGLLSILLVGTSLLFLARATIPLVPLPVKRVMTGGGARYGD